MRESSDETFDSNIESSQKIEFAKSSRVGNSI